MKITEKMVAALLSIIDQGLPTGLGYAQPGEMCVQAAVTVATNDSFSDQPNCVDGVLVVEGININDSGPWINKKDRGEALRQFAIAQLGTSGKFDGEAFHMHLDLEAKKYGGGVPNSPGAMISHLAEAIENGMYRAGTNLRSHAATRRQAWQTAIDAAVRIMTEMGTEGSEYLCLTKLPKEDLQEIKDRMDRIEIDSREWIGY